VRIARAAAGIVVAATFLAGCGGSAGAAGRPSAHQDVTLSLGSAPGLGHFVVTNGWTLYMYPPDHRGSVTCTKADDCEQAWPPLFVGPGRSIVAGPGVRQGLIGSVAGDGGRVVTYGGWPLYFYIGDHKADQVNGQGQDSSWYVVAPDGVPNKADVVSPTG
jgi:predicted lipoprotein with Yx(FWY)xxD motif